MVLVILKVEFVLLKYVILKIIKNKEKLRFLFNYFILNSRSLFAMEWKSFPVPG